MLFSLEMFALQMLQTHLFFIAKSLRKLFLRKINFGTLRSIHSSRRHSALFGNVISVDKPGSSKNSSEKCERNFDRG